MAFSSPTGNSRVRQSTPRTREGWSLRPHFFLLGIIVLYLIVGALFAAQTPPWQAPDEPAHYNVVRQMAAGNLPVIEPSDYDESYRAQAVSSKFGPDYPVEPLTYEDWQPPLYYLLLTPVFLASDGALLPLRLASLIIGLGILVATYAIAGHMWPARHWRALTSTAFVALLPQHVAILASVNNDSLAELIIALILWSLVVLSARESPRQPPSARDWSVLGILLGIGFLTKLTVFIMAPVIVYTIVRTFRGDWPAIFRAGAFVFLPALLLGSIIWVRNMFVYGFLDPLGILAHDAVVLGQPRTSEWFALYGIGETMQRFVTTTFRSFWGQFGWMGVLMDPRIYQILLAFSLMVLAGLLWQWLAASRRRAAGARGDGRDLGIRSILLVTFLMNVLLYAAYNVTYVQHQGRYLFGALIPISLAVTAGIAAWLQPVSRRWPGTALVIPGLLAVSLVTLDIFALYRFIIPQLTMP